MNDAISPDGTGGGHSTPPPNIEYEPVRIDVDSVASVGQALIMQSENVGMASGKIGTKLEGPQEDALGQYASLPVGGGNQDLTVTQFAIRNTERMDEINAFLKNVQTGLGNLGALTAVLTAEFTSQDALNGADIDWVNEIIAAGKNTKTAEA